MRLAIQSGNAYGDHSNGTASPYVTPPVNYDPQHDHIYRDFSYPTYFRPVGMGGTAQSVESLAAQGFGETVSILHVLSVSAAGGPIGVAIGAAVVGLTTIAMTLVNMFKGCGQTCIQASNDANQIEAQLLQNLNTYMSAPVHYASMQAAALNTFDTTWAALMQACGSPALAQAGVNCIKDREQGSCKWKASPGGWTQDAATGKWTYSGYGAAGSGTACWNWYVGYRDPIANDPTVVPDPPPVTATSTSTGTASIDSLLPASLTGSVQIGSVFVPMLGLIGGAVLLIALAH